MTLPWRLLALFLLLRATAALGQMDNATDEPAYSIQPGDVLFISVWRELELQAEVLVRPDGNISFPLAGELVAAGHSTSVLHDELVSRLEKFIPDLFVTVTVQEVLGNKIYILGQVARPGAYVMNPRIDVTQALSVAGGATPLRLWTTFGS